MTLNPSLHSTGSWQTYLAGCMGSQAQIQIGDLHLTVFHPVSYCITLELNCDIFTGMCILHACPRRTQSLAASQS